MASLARSNIVPLARRVLSSANKNNLNASGGTDVPIFEELIAAIASSNPPPAMPRIPAVCNNGSHTSVERGERLERILAQSRSPVDATSELWRHKSNTDEQPPLNQSNSTYGTTPVASIQTLLGVLYSDDSDQIVSKAKGAFVDAGSGRGIPTLAAALSGRFPLAKGIEYQSKWHQSAVALKVAYDKEEQGEHRCELEFFCDDMTKPAGHFAGASCVFLNGVTFDANMCQMLSHRLEQELKITTSAPSSSQRNEEDVFVVSMSRRLALPSFDLIDVLSLNANGNGMFTFYLNRKSRTGSLHHATSDSETMRMLRDTNDGLLDELIEMALVSKDVRLGMSFLATIAASEPTVRQNMGKSSSPLLWETLEMSMEKSASLTQKALGSMVLRAMSDHPVGRGAIASNDSLVDSILAGVNNDEEHPAVRANLLDILSQLLHDSPLKRISNDLDQILERLKDQTHKSESSANLLEALTETVAMKRWWDGHRRELPETK